MKKIFLFLSLISFSTAHGNEKPNVIVLLADDLGYSDLGCQGSEDVMTPNIDSIANNGIRFTDGYVTAPQCGPSRAGLLAGRHQSTFGFESNEFAYDPGLPPSVKIISEYFKDIGYRTGYMGKWGVSSKKHGHPPRRGFDYSYWNQDGNVFFPDIVNKYNTTIHRNNNPVEYPAYSTDAFGSEAVDFIERNKENPFFLFVSFIAPHVPMEAKEEDLKRFAHVEDEKRRTMLAMMSCMDDNIGDILGTLRNEDLEKNTLIFFLSDNGGYSGNSSKNDPFRGTKSQMLEGGIRVPYLVQWKGVLPAGKVYEKPVMSLDILPTSLAAAGQAIKPEWELGGVNLLPYLMGEKTTAPSKTLFWRFHMWTNQPEKDGWAIRRGDWKLVKNGWGQKPVALYNLKSDPREKKNLIKSQPERATELMKEWNEWDSTNITPGSIKL
jgi:arylsulfatase A-like enzyme